MCFKLLILGLFSIVAVACLGNDSWVIPGQPATEMEPIQDRLGDQRARLQAVANLLLDIYKTLAEMRYINPAGIEPGPHDIGELQPLFEELALDPAIIYLYSILPYINTRIAGTSDFFDGSQFVDFRQGRNVEYGRNPFHAIIDDDADDDAENGQYMRP